ncbi:MAG: TetR/AcrR family transcriptional regulator [Actinobacteria bacterium]|nr:MAG: TetR/AcrR family transcriptional regulator [Actinomycetota bacterium]
MAERKAGARERMVVSAALLMRERGARATSLDAVLEHSGAPRGSIYHHFPGGREQLLREATDYAGAYVERRLERGGDPLAALDELFEEYRANLVTSDFRAGCPVVAVAVESNEDLRDHVVGAFDRWRRALARRLAGCGIDEARADELAVLIIATFEGGLILSRAYREPAPLDVVRRQCRELVQAELEAE